MKHNLTRRTTMALMIAGPLSCIGPALILAPSMAPAAEKEIVLREGLLIKRTGQAGRSAFHTDALEAKLVAGQWTTPHAGDTLSLPNGSNATWVQVSAQENGSFNSFAEAPSTNRMAGGGYLYLPYTAETERVMILQAAGHNMVYVNGEPRTGDPYGNGSVALPVRLRAGLNEFLVSGRRGSISVSLAPPKAPVAIDLRDTTLPDVIVGEKGDLWAAVIIANSTLEPVDDLVLTASSSDGKTTESRVSGLLPVSTRKVGFRLNYSGHSATNFVEYALKLTRQKTGRKAVLDTAKVRARVRKADQTHRETFVSDIDGSVQYFAVTPARPLDKNRPARALVLSTHGAAVEGQSQAEAYGSKTWAQIVAPTNRRPYGFDWEDWGRRDALEVLEIARSKYQTDPAQTYLTGHSMGGHGTWYLGVTYPDRFAAIAPSAGWISWFSYGGGRRDQDTNEVRALLQRASTPVDTLRFKSNYLQQGIYILHGDADDNVPVSEARTMRAELEPFHRDFMYHEQPGAGHWWGNPCVDWPPIFELFARHKIPATESMTTINFSTANPEVSASCHWAVIEAQEHALAKSAVNLRWDPPGRRFSGTTENVQRLSLKLDHVRREGKLTVELDGQSIKNLTVPAEEPRLWFTRRNGQWAQSARPALDLKGPHRYGPFKEAFNHRMIFVYGTRGTAEENAWAIAKARFDAESFWYRGNGSIDVIPDTRFNPASEPDRGVILYGNADSNSAWPALLGNSPVQVRRGSCRIGDRSLDGADLACLFLRPRPGSTKACVGVVSGTGPAGLRLTDRVPYILAGVALPDCTVMGPDVLEKGARGARVAGFFGTDWSVQQGEFAWRNE